MVDIRSSFLFAGETELKYVKLMDVYLVLLDP